MLNVSAAYWKINNATDLQLPYNQPYSFTSSLFHQVLSTSSPRFPGSYLFHHVLSTFSACFPKSCLFHHVLSTSSARLVSSIPFLKFQFFNRGSGPTVRSSKHCHASRCSKYNRQFHFRPVDIKSCFEYKACFTNMYISVCVSRWAMLNTSIHMLWIAIS